MAAVTQCPACATRFRVVPDQLKISQGWVRCGKCGEVFDARKAMAAPADSPTPSVPVPPQVSIVLRQESPEPEVGSAGPPAVPEIALRPPSEAVPDDLVSDALAFEAEVRAEREPAPATSILAKPEPEPEPEPLAAVVPEPDRHAAHAAASPVPEEVPLPDPAPEWDTSRIGFVRQARRQQRWQRPWVRAVLGVLALVLAGLLAAQVVFTRRDWVVAAMPSSRPWLSAVCDTLGCDLAPWPQIESVVIDSSALVRERDGVYRFEVGLKNTSGLALATPAVELSLTQAQDEVVASRVLLPADWDEPEPTLAPHATTPFSVRLSVSDLRTAGYRALVFYP